MEGKALDGEFVAEMVGMVADVATMILTGRGFYKECKLSIQTNKSIVVSTEDTAKTKGIDGGNDSSVPEKRKILNVGAGDNPIPCATNIDIDPLADGVQFGDANNLNQFGDGEFDHVIALNPYRYSPLESDMGRVLKSGGTMTITGGMSNRYFNKIFNASPEKLSELGYEIVSKGDAYSVFLKYGGKIIGGERKINSTTMQIILRKK